MLLSELANTVNGTLHGQDVCFSGVSIDGRTITPGDLYVAIKGDRFDGHQFVDQAIQAGAVASMVEQQEDTHNATVSVRQTKQALGQLAKHWRQRFDFPIVGITGSNGKTTVKELTHAVLSQQYNTLATKGNLNNELGVPLTLLRLRNQHEAAVIEMGANHHGEIAYLTDLTHPTIGLVNNAGAAHLEGFGDLAGVAQGKGELFANLPTTGTAVINADDVFCESWKEMADHRKIVLFGLSEQADVRATNITSQFGMTSFQLEYQQYCQPVQVPLTGNHNVMNALAAAAIGIECGLNLNQISKGYMTVKPVSGRMQVLPGKNQSIIINDCYNANPTSFEAALKAIQDLGEERWCVLGDFGELGPDSESLHKKLGSMAHQYGVSRLLATGDSTKLSIEAFGEDADFFESQHELINILTQQLYKGVVVLVKGSRAQKLETIVEALTDESAD